MSLGQRILLNTSRTWARHIFDTADHHFRRYEFAAAYSRGRVLDAACGCGYGSKWLLTNAEMVVGVDSNLEAIEWARKNFQGPYFVHAKIEDRPWHGKFDTVVSLETIEHIRDPKPVLETFREIGTVLIASVPNEENHPFKAETYKNDDSPHFRHYTPNEFQELLEGAGFKVKAKFCQKSKAKPHVVEGTDGMFLIYICA